MSRGGVHEHESQIQEEVVQSPDDAAPGICFSRFFSREDVDPFDEIEWELRAAVIGNEKGETVFEQLDVEIPKSWSQTATNIVVSKYFRGQIGAPEREHSVKQLIGRVVDTIRAWGEGSGYFRTSEDAQCFSDELSHILVNQHMAFNSPVWFNLGVADTPHLDRLCDCGALFENAYCNLPLCTPSRFSMLAGMCVHSMRKLGSVSPDDA